MPSLGPIQRRIAERAAGVSVSAASSAPVEHVVVVESGAQPHASVVREPVARWRARELERQAAGLSAGKEVSI